MTNPIYVFYFSIATLRSDIKNNSFSTPKISIYVDKVIAQVGSDLMDITELDFTDMGDLNQ